MNIVDALVVTLNLDAAKFKAGAKETDATLAKTSGAANKTSKDMEAWGKNAAASMGKLRNEVLGLLAVFTAGVGIKNFVENTINSTASLGRLSQNLSMSAKDLAMWQLANKNAGGSVEGMTAQLKEAQQAVADYALHRNNAANNAFQTSGLSKPEDFKDAATLLKARADAIAKINATHGSGIAQTYATSFGISEDTYYLLIKGALAVEQMRKEQEKLATEQARASGPAEAFRKKWDTLKNSLEAVGVKVLTALLPQLIRLTDWVSAHQADIEAWANRAVKAIEKFVKWADGAAKSVGGWKNVLIGLIALNVIGMVAPFFAFAASLAQIGVALGVIGGTAGIGALALLGKLARLGVAPALLFHSEGLNKGEGAELAKRRAMGATVDGQSGGSMPRGMRNNNPGNIEYGAFAKRQGATGSDGRFAIFPTMEAGQSAQQALLGGYLSSGANTVQKAISKWAPGSENNTAAYVAAVSKQLGVGPDQVLNGSHIPALADAISRHENGPAWDRRNAMGAVNMSRAARPRAGGATGSWGNSTSETNINGPINIVTQATDAEGIAKSIKPALGKYAMASQSNTGLD